LTQYLSTNKCLAEIFPDVKQHAVLEDMKEYLRGRGDSLRKILEAIISSIDADDDALYEAGLVVDIADADLLLEIFDDKTMFVKEYLKMLSDSLISLDGFDVDRQIHHLEVLKDKFGESEMNDAEVMMRDVAESRRILNQFHGANQEKVVCDNQFFTALVLSDQYWPHMTQSACKLPEFIERYRV
jgi:transposase-like protein